MTKLFLASTIALMSFGSVAMAASKEDCTAMMSKGGTSGMMSGDMAKPYVDAMTAAKMPLAKPGEITDQEFMTACMADTFKSIK